MLNSWIGYEMCDGYRPGVSYWTGTASRVATATGITEMLVAMMLGSRDPPALAYVGPPIVAAFNQK